MSSLTNFLKLFKWDTKTDGSQKFDIDKALNENIDKIDAGIENAQKTTITTAISEEITVTDCAEVNAKLDIKNGKTIQDGTPTPEALIEIRNVGDNVNLIDIYNINSEGYTITKAGITYTFLSDGRIKLNGTSTATNSIPIIGAYQSGNYKLFFNGEYSQSGLVNGVSLSFYDGSTRIANFYDKEVKKIDNKKIDYVILAIDNGITFNDVIIYPKLEQNPVATSYSKYNCANIDFTLKNQDNSQSKTVSFPLEEGQVLHNRDYLAEDGIHQIRNQIILDGTEQTITCEFIGNTTRFSISVNLQNYKFNYQALCSHFKYVYSYSEDTEHFYIAGSGSNIHIFIDSTIASTDTQIRTWLAEQYSNGTPVTIEYELAEEIVTPYTTEQKEAYYQLQHLLMYEGYTNISCIDEIKPDIQLTYYYNNLLNKSYAKRFDEVDDNIKELETITEKNIITAGIFSAYTITSSDVEKLVLSSANEIKIGDKLSIVDGSIVVGKGISCIKVSAQEYFSVVTSGNHNVAIYLNDTSICTIAQNLTTNWQGICLATKIIPVTEGDKISLYVKGVANEKVNHSLNGTFITVEAVG